VSTHVRNRAATEEKHNESEANPSVGAGEMSAADLKEIFLGAKTSVDGSDMRHVLAEIGAAHETFLKAFVGKSEQALKNAATKGAIGYISADADAAGVKTTTVK